jgi:8-oxo-dGTP pyrophosphatase MutT (NUDIX family)
VRPRDAASLILLRPGKQGPEVLMGRRASRHRFVPGHYVFPGGRVDAADYRTPVASPLRREVANCLRADCSRGHGFAVAAVRETYEETGLVLGEIGEDGLRPALNPLQYIMRAITPVQSPIRYHARFFLAEAAAVKGSLESNGELLDLGWRPIGESLRLPIVDITQLILERLAQGFRPQKRVPLFCFRSGWPRFL